MKHLIFTIAAAALLVLATETASAQLSKTAIGGNLAISFDRDNFYFGIAPKGQYYFTDNFRGEAVVTFFLPKNSIMFLDLGINLHYLFPIADNASLYPILGASFYAMSEEKRSDLSLWPTGALGGGIELAFLENWVVSGELKYKITTNSQRNYGMLTVG
ncbi:MAG: porin family protein, partial [Tannerellaceae bacterium]|nr:porin family protein [Tannerellaceae bacterium]